VTTKAPAATPATADGMPIFVIVAAMAMLVTAAAMKRRVK